MSYFITYLLIALAANMNAVMDRTENLVAFNRSIFSHLDTKFWCKEISWKYATKIFGCEADAWHISKSMMIVLLAIAMVSFSSTDMWWLDILLVGVTWNISFTFSYHKLLYR